MEQSNQQQNNDSAIPAIVGGVALVVGAAFGFFANQLFGSSKSTSEQEAIVPHVNTPTVPASGNTEDKFCCPITLERLKDPYISTQCGHTFEKVNIENWLEKQSRCPLCNEPMTKNDLIQNFHLKEVIDSNN